MGNTTDTNNLPLTGETATSTTTPNGKKGAVQLRTPHDFSLTLRALEGRSADLRKLAEKTNGEGYTREARAIRGDAEAIDQHIVPAFRDQRELPLVTEEALRKEVEGALRVAVFRAFNGLDDPKTLSTHATIRDRRDGLIDVLTDRVVQFAIELADAAFVQGEAARDQTPEALAHKQVAALRVSS